MSDEENAEVERIGECFAAGYRVLLIEAYPEAYGGFLKILQAAVASMVPFVVRQRVKRAREN